MIERVPMDWQERSKLEKEGVNMKRFEINQHAELASI
jgi:hypothetical protein